jgi:MoaA/NifB/PqqE/SkfB family radical SAM enzyme
MRFNSFWRYRRFILSRGFISAMWQARKNVIAASLGCLPAAGPFMAELDVTYRCNCRCRMCQRWRNSRDGELTLTEYQNLAITFCGLGVHQVSIAGGEPLLREDIFAIIDCFVKCGMSVNLCTNGILLEKYAGQLREAGKICVTVSLDGATAPCHENIRGAPNTYSLIEKGISTLMAYPAPYRPFVRVRMTVSNFNMAELRPFYLKWRDLVDDVLLQPVHRCDTSYYTGFKKTELDIDPEALSEQLAGTPFATDGYMVRLITSLRTDGGFPQYRCYAGVLMVRIDPWGNVFPCLEQHACVGSVREDDFRVIWDSERFDLERKRIADEGRCSCWYNNTALIGHYGNLLRLTHAGEIKKRANLPFG